MKMKHQHDRMHQELEKEDQNACGPDKEPTPKRVVEDHKLQWSVTLGKSNLMAQANAGDKMSYEDLKIITKF